MEEDKPSQSSRLKKKLSTRDKVILIGLILILVWEVDILSWIRQENVEEIQITPLFLLIVPTDSQTLSTDGKLRASFKNRGMDEANIEDIKVKNLDSNILCIIERVTPLKLEPEEKFTISSDQCGVNNAQIGRPFRLEIRIKGTSTNRSLAYSRALPRPPNPAFYLSTPEEMKKIEDRFKKQFMNVENAYQEVDFESYGILEGNYSI
jgi:hypothetical protein